jgi:diketogulonate reductase-like aldo/keto reductase
VNQIELSPYNTRTALVQLCWEQQIYPEAYSPLTCAARLTDPRLALIASKYQVSAAQILIRWSLQRGYICIPKSTRHARIVENASVFHFEVSADDMAALDRFDEYFVSGWDPTVAE